MAYSENSYLGMISKLILRRFPLLVLSLVYQCTLPSTLAQTASLYRAEVVAEEALVYSKADFDAPILDSLKKGEVFEISRRLYGAFHAVRLRSGKVGFIADSDVRPLGKKSQNRRGGLSAQSEAKADVKADVKAQAKTPIKKKPDANSKTVGGTLMSLRFREDTMGLRPTDQMPFFGLRLSGPDLVVAGPVLTDINFLISGRAPNYYSEVSSGGASGYAFLVDFALEMPNKLNRLVWSYWGFGPFVKYSRWQTSIENLNSANSVYVMEDMALGLKLQAGLLFHLGGAKLRLEIPYYWEKMHHSGLALSVQFPF
jgi:hypothetical protein